MRSNTVLKLKQKKRNRILISLCALLFLIVGTPIMTYIYFSLQTEDMIFDSPTDVPKVKTALVLGTSKYMKNGKINQYFRHRMDAAQLLYIHRRVNKILLSGDHKTIYYNEPLAMKSSLCEKGVPEKVMIMDPSGLRTFDSVIRAYKIYGENNIIIVSQRFHLERALFIAKCRGVNAYGFVANDSGDNFANTRLKIRESYARILTLLDLYIFDTQPQDMSPQVNQK